MEWGIFYRRDKDKWEVELIKRICDNRPFAHKVFRTEYEARECAAKYTKERRNDYDEE
jgi:hypothetical protein